MQPAATVLAGSTHLSSIKLNEIKARFNAIALPADALGPLQSFDYFKTGLQCIETDHFALFHGTMIAPDFQSKSRELLSQLERLYLEFLAGTFKWTSVAHPKKVGIYVWNTGLPAVIQKPAAAAYGGNGYVVIPDMVTITPATVFHEVTHNFFPAKAWQGEMMAEWLPRHAYPAIMGKSHDLPCTLRGFQRQFSRPHIAWNAMQFTADIKDPFRFVYHEWFLIQYIYRIWGVEGISLLRHANTTRDNFLTILELAGVPVLQFLAQFAVDAVSTSIFDAGGPATWPFFNKLEVAMPAWWKPVDKLQWQAFIVADLAAVGASAGKTVKWMCTGGPPKTLPAFRVVLATEYGRKFQDLGAVATGSFVLPPSPTHWLIVVAGEGPVPTYDTTQPWRCDPIPPNPAQAPQVLLQVV